MTLLGGEVCERRGDNLSVAKLGYAFTRKRHRRARVEHDQHGEIRRLAKLACVESVAAREELPVEMLEIVADAIRPMLAKLRAVPVERAAMTAGAQSFDDDAR